MRSPEAFLFLPEKGEFDQRLGGRPFVAARLGVKDGCMILGIVSDNHGNATRLAHALDLLKRLGAEAFVHCGDIGDEASLDQLAGRRAWFVWGNTDSHEPTIESYAEAIGLPVPVAVPLIIELEGKSIHVYHGHERQFMRMLQFICGDDTVSLGDLTHGVDYILYGHTHLAANAHIGSVRMINPGALHRARVYTVATVDLKRDVVEYWVVDDHAEPGARPKQYHPR